MKTLVRKNDTTKTGYELVVIADDGKETITAITENGKGPDGPKYLKLPTNPAGRQWLAISKVTGNELELTAHVARTLNTTERAPRKPDEDFLTGKDRETFLALKEKIRKAREEAAKKPAMTDLEKAQRAFERAKAQVEAAKAAAQTPAPAKANNKKVKKESK